MLAHTKLKLGKKEEAEKLLQKALDVNPRDHESYLEIGQIHEHGDLEKALFYY